MVRIIRGNSTGKTRELVEKAKTVNNSVIVCKNPERMCEKANSYGVYGVKCVSYTDFISSTTEKSDEVFFIDDIDAFFQCLGVDVGGYTLTVD